MVRFLFFLTVFSSSVLAAFQLYESVPYCVQEGTRLKLDLAVPTKSSVQTPLVLFVHGGGWAHGSRKNYLDRVKRYAELGFASATIDYRLASFPKKKADRTPDAYQVGAIFPAQIEDVKCAIRWAKDHSQLYGFSSRRIALVGSSAGGTLVLLAGLSQETAFRTGDWLKQSASVQAIVNYYGTADFLKRYASEVPSKKAGRRTLERFLGGKPVGETKERYRFASPVTHLSKKAPPTLTFHGAHDGLVSVEQGEILDRKFRALKRAHDLVIFPGQGHGFDGSAQRSAERRELRFLRDVFFPQG